MKLYKVLGKDGRAVNGGTGKWYLPRKKKDGTWIPGKWMPPIKGALKPCRNGYHLCRSKDLIGWLNETIYEAEYKGEIIKDSDKVVVRNARLMKHIESWNERTARLFAADCGERVLPIFEKKYPNDNRPRKAIEAARLFANNKITRKDLAAAWAAARAAAWDAAGDAARDAAWAAARAAAWDAARAAARDAARAAAWDAARAAARDAETKWQIKRLIKYLAN